MHQMSMNLVDLSSGLNRLQTGLWPLQERFETPEDIRFGNLLCRMWFDNIHMYSKDDVS
jgi:hypothetical protein